MENRSACKCEINPGPGIKDATTWAQWKRNLRSAKTNHKKKGGGGRKIARHKIRLDGNIWGLILLPLNCNKSPNKWKILQATNCYVLSETPHTFTAISGSKTEKPIPMTSLNINTRAVIALGIVIDFLDPANPRALRILDIWATPAHFCHLQQLNAQPPNPRIPRKRQDESTRAVLKSQEMPLPPA